MSVLSLVPLVAAISIAQAYVPPSFFVVRMLGRKHANIESGKFRSRVTFYKKNGDALPALQETLTFQAPDRMITRLYDPAGHEVAAHSRRLITGKSGEL